jgi:hypothetical protein
MMPEPSFTVESPHMAQTAVILISDRPFPAKIRAKFGLPQAFIYVTLNLVFSSQPPDIFLVR